VSQIEVIKPSIQFIDTIDTEQIMSKLELCGRNCYKSEDKITPESADRFVRMIVKKGHESVLEHVSLTTRIICDRSTSHQLVRHRIAAYSQESQRFCNYGKAGKLQVVCPPSIAKNDEVFNRWYGHMVDTYDLYLWLLERNIPAEDARSVLANATKTEVIATYNLRQWKHVFYERCSKRAQWQIREIMTFALQAFNSNLPAVFNDVHGCFCE